MGRFGLDRFAGDLSQNSFPVIFSTTTLVFSNPTHFALGRRGLGSLPHWTPIRLTPMDQLTRGFPKGHIGANFCSKTFRTMGIPLDVVVAYLANKVSHTNICETTQKPVGPELNWSCLKPRRAEKDCRWLWTSSPDRPNSKHHHPHQHRLTLTRHHARLMHPMHHI